MERKVVSLNLLSAKCLILQLNKLFISKFTNNKENIMFVYLSPKYLPREKRSLLC